ncbi:MAG: hypothetical protein JWO82_1227 [Akkermansiaceae bacterium]|nr:hypothetical protein [Akkermansiaceae bacterium]
MPWAGIVLALFIGWVAGNSSSIKRTTSGDESLPPPRAALVPVGKPSPAAPVLPAQSALPEGIGSIKDSPVETLTGKIVGVTDGDTVTLLSGGKKQTKIRLEGIDAPESGQEYGAKSKAALSALIAGKNVSVTISGQDRYGRSLGWIEADGASVNRRMVADGWAWQYLEYNHDADIAGLQVKAKAAHLGLWAAPNPPMPPWEFRKLGRLSAASAVPKAVPQAEARPVPKETKREESTGPKKYWINSNGVRHNQHCRWYGNTKSGHFSNEAEGRACGNCGG